LSSVASYERLLFWPVLGGLVGGVNTNIFFRFTCAVRFSFDDSSDYEKNRYYAIPRKNCENIGIITP
jgi:hypothetical protein